MDKIKASAETVRIANAHSRVWKEECSFSYHNAECEGGILVDMNSFYAFSPKHAKINYEKTRHNLYLNIKRKRVVKKVEIKEGDDQKPKVLGIGVEGGFKSDEDLIEFENSYAIVVLPNFESVPYPNDELPDKVKQSAESIITAESMEKKEQIKAWVADDKLEESIVARDLVQLDTGGKKLLPYGLKCEKCSLDTNLWLNLTDGYIGCGREQGNVGGQGHALAHYNQTHYPIAVKLGTITPTGADVYSYPEDNMVIDPKLEEHLLHWGLDMKNLYKTDKSLAELEIEAQFNLDWSKALEKSKKLTPLYGPGYTGIENLGNSCYMASVMQVIFKIPEFVDRYVKESDRFFNTANFNNLSRDFHVQMSKLGSSLHSGDYSKPPVEDSKPEDPKRPVVRPFSFKSFIGENHAEFSSNRQQDAMEFFLHFIDTAERQEHAKKENLDPTKIFQFHFEEKLQCVVSQLVKYNYSKQNFLSLLIPLEKAKNKEEVAAYQKRQEGKTEEEKKKERTDGTAEEPVWPRVTLNDCFEQFQATELNESYVSPVTNKATGALIQKRFAEFPKYLVIQMNRFVINKDGYQKLEALVDIPDDLDLEYLRGKGLQENEKPLPESTTAAPAIKLDEGVIQSIMDMGFTRVKAEHAVYNNQNQGTEAALNWLFQRMDDPAIDIPLQLNKGPSSDNSNLDEGNIKNLMDMGFDRKRCVAALKKTSNNVERALDYLFSHPDEPIEEEESNKPKEKPAFNKNEGRYKLFGFITHMGKNAHSGHYVAHINADGKWAFYNDINVAESQEPPKELAYIYFYRRVD